LARLAGETQRHRSWMLTERAFSQLASVASVRRFGIV
jgi:hypothetical protein